MARDFAGNVPVLHNNGGGWLGNVPWAEWISAGGATQEGSHGWESNQCLFSLIVYFDDYVTGAAVRALLGTNIFNPQTGNLDRELPARHPYKRNLYADRVVAVRPISWQDKVDGDTSVPFSTYSHCVLTVLFTQPKWFGMIDDTTLDNIGGSPRQEWRRFTSILYAPAVENLSREGANWKWAEGQSASPSGPIVGNTLLAPLGQFLPKPNMLIRWYRVPYVGLFSAGGLGPPTNLNAGTMTVNSATFLNYGPGRLLLLPPKIDVLEAPDFNSVNTGAVGVDVPLHCTVELPVVNFDPPAGVPSPLEHGHNLVPFADGLYYTVTDAATGTQRVYQKTAFADLFRLQS